MCFHSPCAAPPVIPVPSCLLAESISRSVALYVVRPPAVQPAQHAVQPRHPHVRVVPVPSESPAWSVRAACCYPIAVRLNTSNQRHSRHAQAPSCMRSHQCVCLLAHAREQGCFKLRIRLFASSAAPCSPRRDRDIFPNHAANVPILHELFRALQASDNCFRTNRQAGTDRKPYGADIPVVASFKHPFDLKLDNRG